MIIKVEIGRWRNWFIKGGGGKVYIDPPHTHKQTHREYFELFWGGGGVILQISAHFECMISASICLEHCQQIVSVLIKRLCICVRYRTTNV